MPDLPNTSPRAHERLSAALTGVAMVLLLACVAARPFMGESPLHVSQLRSALAVDDSAGADSAPEIDRGELARVTFAVVLLGAFACWIVGASVSGRGAVEHRPLAALVLALAVLGLTSAMHASDKRSALNGILEQASLLGAAVVAANVFRDRKRFVLLLAVLCAVGGAIAVKCYAQYFMEIPDRIAQFTMYRDRQLSIAGFAPGTPQAAAYENRLKDVTVTGYFGLANLLASLLIVTLLAAAGLAADKLLAAREGLAAWRLRRRKGELHTPMLAAVVTIAISALIVPALLLTRSRGGSIAGLAALAAWAIVYRLRGPLARHWKKALLVAAAAVVIASASVAAYGLKFDRLPTKTLTFRWHYWTASAQIIREHPLWGVGAGNFPSAYLAARRPEAEEAVKMPHNFVMHILAEMGLPGGLCYLAAIAYIMIGICRPRRRQLDCPAAGTAPGAGARYSPLILLPVLAAPAVARMLFADSSSGGLLLYDVVLPTLVLLAMLLGAGWFGGRYLAGLDLPVRTGRVALACGAAGFLLHDLIEFGLFMPATATVFWVAAGACLASSGGQTADAPTPPVGPAPSSGRIGPMAMLLPIVALAAALWQLWLPVAKRTELTQQMIADFRKGDRRGATGAADAALLADRLDPYLAADAARLFMRDAPYAACDWADQALRRDEANSPFWRLAGDAHMFLRWPDALNYSWDALPPDLDKAEKAFRAELMAQPKDPALMAQLAGIMLEKGRTVVALELLHRAVEIDPQSPMLKVLLGDIHCRQGGLAEACEMWRRAAEMTRSDAQEYVDLMARAVDLDPNDCRLRIAFAQMLLWAGRGDAAKTQIDRAVWLDGRLDADSIQRLKEPELTQIGVLKVRAECLSSAGTQPAPSRPSTDSATTNP